MHKIVNTTLEAEIEALVARAVRGSGFLHAGEHAFRLARAHPSCGLTGEEIVEEIILAAAKAGVPVEMNRPMDFQHP